MRKIDLIQQNKPMIKELVKAGLAPTNTLRDIEIYLKMDSFIVAGLSKYRAAYKCSIDFNIYRLGQRQIVKIYDEYKRNI